MPFTLDGIAMLDQLAPPFVETSPLALDASAKHTEAEGHATVPTPAVSPCVVKVHVVPPFVVTMAAGPVWSPPAEMQNVNEPHEIEFSGASPHGFDVAAVHEEPPLVEKYCSLLPDATHTVDDGHVTAVRVPVRPEGGCGIVWLALHVDPPLVVTITAPVALCPDPDAPAITQLVDELHDTPFIMVMLLGTDCEVHVDPPLAVVMMTGEGGDPPEPPPPEPPLAVPIATHDVVVAHETEFMNPTPDGRVCTAHEVPPLEVVSIAPDSGIPFWAPAAKHVVAVGQETPERMATVEGRL